MKKKKIWIPILIILVILGIGFILFFMMYKYSLGITVGRCLIADNGSYLLVDERSPMRISNLSSNDELFSDLKTGDKILVVHNGVNESYPAQTGAYCCLRLGSGNIDDISEEVISELTELGWLKGDVVDIVLDNTKRVEYSHGDKYMALEIPEGWKYSITEYSESAYAIGISFWPEGYTEGKISLQYFLNGFGVCGTGLTTTEIEIAGMAASRGVYDNDVLWSYISFHETDRDYAVINEGAEQWWQEHGDVAMAILETIQIGECEDEIEYAKPVIYLYPKETTEVKVDLDFNGELTCTYPEYQDGWSVIAEPDGTLIDKKTGEEYSYLFWEGTSDVEYDMSEGYVVKGEDTAEFLQRTLAEMGLTPKEYNEFIVYWLPKMQENPYNLIIFQRDVYTDNAVLNISPKPDSVLRIFMAYQGLEEPIEVKEPEIEPFERTGFTVVEWGGTEVK